MRPLKKSSILRKQLGHKTDPSKRYENVVTKYLPGQLSESMMQDSYWQGVCNNGVALRVQWFTPSIVRFWYSIEGDFGKDFSYAIDERFKAQPTSVSFTENADFVFLEGDNLNLMIAKEGLRVTIFDKHGNVLNEDMHGFYQKDSIVNGVEEVKVTKKAAANERFFGLGDRAADMDMRGKAFENWCEDAFAFGPDTDPMYRAVPFFIGMREARAYGIFLDNSYRTRFSFDRRNDGIMSFSANGGDMKYFFIAGPAPLDVCKNYALLTGTAALPPRWALGYHQCRWSYYPEARVKEVAARFRELSIPCDSIWLDIDYMDGYRCFTWSPQYFPNPRALTDALRADGFKTVVMIDPGIKVEKGYSVYDSGVAGDHFVKRPNGRIFKGPVWPGDCAFPDYTNPETREWWADQYKELLTTQGVDGVWNDMNEPAVFEIHLKTMPSDLRHHYEGLGSDHAKAHNIYGLQMSRASHAGMRRWQPERRPFLLSRATFAGGQRYAALWTGDNIANWEHLRLANIQCQRLSISGFSFVGSDIGGFVDIPDGELFTRWLQLSVFHPLMRSHTMGHHDDGSAAVDLENITAKAAKVNTDQEPWSFGAPWTNLCKEAIELRYRLLPYLYTAFWQHQQDGTPVIQPLWMAFGEDTQAVAYESEFMFGPHLLVCPIEQPDQKEVNVYMPSGQDWFCFHTHQRYEGGKLHHIETNEHYVPLFARAGAVIPTWSVTQHTGQRPEELTLWAFGGKGPNVESCFFDDSGDGFGGGMVRKFQADPEKKALEESKTGSFEGTALKETLKWVM